MMLWTGRKRKIHHKKRESKDLKVDSENLLRSLRTDIMKVHPAERDVSALTMVSKLIIGSDAMAVNK